MKNDLETKIETNPQSKKTIRQLYHEHDGVRWFERFKDNYRTNRGIPKLFEWHNIRLYDLHELLATQRFQRSEIDNSLRRLVDTRFITSRDSEFNPNKQTNFVNVKRLSELLARLCYKRPRQILEKEDPYFNAVVKSYLHNRLVPFLIKHGIEKFRKIPFLEAARLIDTDEMNLRGFIKRHSINKVEYRNHKRIILGIDLAIYSMRRNLDRFSTESEIIDLFALTDIDTQRLRLFPNEEGRFSGRSYVLPFYDSVSLKARKLIKAQDLKYDHLTLTPIQVNSTTYHLTPGAKMAYCHSHSLTEFDDGCEEFIKENIKNGIREKEGKQEKIKSKFLVLIIRGDNRIVSAKSNMAGYSNPQDSEPNPEDFKPDPEDDEAYQEDDEDYEPNRRAINKTHYKGTCDTRGIGRAGLFVVPEDVFFNPNRSQFNTSAQHYARE